MEQQTLITVQTTQKNNGQRGGGGGGGTGNGGGNGIKKMYNYKSKSLESSSKFNNFEEVRNGVNDGNGNNDGSRKMMQRSDSA